jgi:hypothetical protein
MLARGFTSSQATRLIGRKGFKEIKEMWDIFDRQHRTLQLMIGNNEWQHVPKAVEMRNRLVHGQQVFKAQNCDAYTKHVLAALKKLHREIRSDYGSDPWTVLKDRKKSKLQWDDEPQRRSATKRLTKDEARRTVACRTPRAAFKPPLTNIRYRRIGTVGRDIF